MRRRGSEKRAINRPESRAVDLAAQETELVTQDHELDVLDVGTAPAADEQAQQRPKAR